MYTLEMCAGGGGQAIGLHNAGFKHRVLIENDEFACGTLRHNNDMHGLGWERIVEGDLREFAETEAQNYRGLIDLVAGGVPCPPFSYAGKQLGKDDERDLFPTALKIVEKVQPRAVMLENVRGLMDAKFTDYREDIISKLRQMGYEGQWRMLNADNFGVPQKRPRSILVAFWKEHFELFQWPNEKDFMAAPTVGEALYDEMASRGWKGAFAWREKANKVAPTVVGGSKKHGGPDLGPTRAKREWHALGVNAHRLAADDEIPDEGFRGALGRDGSIREGYEHMPLLSVPMVAKLQGFPKHWEFVGSKTHAYRQVGNAFPPPVAQAVGQKIFEALLKMQQGVEAAE